MTAREDDQSDIFDLLQDPATYGLPCDAQVERVDTHGAAVFLAGDFAYKIKKAIKLPFLDFSTRELRHVACENELRLNRRTAPSLYLDLLKITLDADGRPALEGEGETVDWVIKMRRFPADALLDDVARRDRLTGPMMDRLADGIARFHRDAERYDDEASAEFGRLARVNADRFRTFAGGVFDSAVADRLIGDTDAWVRALGPWLDQRARQGFVRHCHGDLHLRNIYLNGDTPELFDAVEFDDRLGRSDVMYDLAFLLMDLWHRDHRAEANRVLNRYLLRTGDYEGLGALPLFLSLRAGIRAHVSATMAEDAQEPEGLREEARQYMQLALGFLSPPAPMLIGVGGFSGSGKSTVAAALAPSVGPAPGAVCLRSDELRKVMHGVEPQDRLPPQAYDPSVSRRVYAELRNRAGRVLQQGHAVIADAVHDRADSRSDLRAVADEHDAAFKGFWLSASEEAMAARIEARHGDASDADASVMRAQLQRGAGKVDWLQLSAGLAVDDIAARAAAALPSDCVIEDG